MVGHDDVSFRLPASGCAPDSDLPCRSSRSDVGPPLGSIPALASASAQSKRVAVCSTPDRYVLIRCYK